MACFYWSDATGQLHMELRVQRPPLREARQAFLAREAKGMHVPKGAERSP